MLRLAPTCLLSCAFLFLQAACSEPGSGSCPAGAGCAGTSAGNDSGGGGRGGSGPDLGSLAGSGSEGAGESGCIEEKVEFDAQLPNVMLLVDMSGSMILPDISGISRWAALEEALFGAQGMVPELETEMRFGLTLYTSAKSADAPECPYLREAPLALDNAATLAELFRSETPRGTTPTGQSLDPTWRSLAALPESDFIGPRIIVLATDGEPTLCGATDEPDVARQLSATAVEEAFANGVTTFALALGNELGADHLQELANLGQGFPAADSIDRSYRALDVAGLAEAFRSIAMRARSCAFELDGVVPEGQAPRGTVLLDGEPLTHEDPDGWVLLTSSQLALQGAACEAIRSGAGSLDIRFPCGTVVPK
jgi:hypothetical protein